MDDVVFSFSYIITVKGENYLNGVMTFRLSFCSIEGLSKKIGVGFDQDFGVYKQKNFSEIRRRISRYEYRGNFDVFMVEM